MTGGESMRKAVCVLLITLFICSFFLPFVQAEEAGLESGQEKGNGEQSTAAEELCLAGLRFFSEEKFAEALPFFERAVKENPDYLKAYFGIGECNYHLGRYEEAIEAFKQVIRIEPGYAKAHYGLGVAYYKLDRFKEAIEACKQAIHIKPDYAEAHFVLGLAYLKTGDKGSALEEYRILKNLNSDFAEQLFNRIPK